MRRCDWAGNDDLMVRYHDTEWGVPKHDDRRLFESLVLDGAQAGLSWATILNKRESYRRAFDGFDPDAVAAYDDTRLVELLADPGIVRNRLKIASAIGKREGARAGAGGVWKLFSLHLAFCGRQADQELLEERGRAASHGLRSPRR